MIESKTVTTSGWREILNPSIEAVKRNWAPIVLMQVSGALLVLAYYQFESVRNIARSLGEAKESAGVWFVMASGAVAGGVLPQLAKAFTGNIRRLDRTFWQDLAYSGFVFAVIGLEVNRFYQFQTVIFGSGIGFGTLVKKMMLDMFVASPVVFSPTGMILLRAKQVQFDSAKIRAAFSWTFYREWVIPTLPINWVFWIPIVLCVYSLPLPLQFPFSQISEACWSLMFVFMAKDMSRNPTTA